MGMGLGEKKKMKLRRIRKSPWMLGGSETTKLGQKKTGTQNDDFTVSKIIGLRDKPGEGGKNS